MTGSSVQDDRAAALRGAMVDRLKEHGLKDDRVEAAFRAVPRHAFLPGVALEKAYENDAIVTRSDEKQRPISSSSQPAVMVAMAEQLELADGMRVLEIGAGTGYNAAILAELVGDAGRVVTLDIDPEIAAEARSHLEMAGYGRVEVRTGDGWEGAPDAGPFDRIELTASVSDLSPAWVDQLVDGGILLVPLWTRMGWQMLAAFRKQGVTLVTSSVGGGGFMPLRGTGAPIDTGIQRDGTKLNGAAPQDVDTILDLLRCEPRLVLGPAHEPQSWDRLSAIAALGQDVIGVSAAGKGLSLGLYDRERGGLAMVAFSHVGYLGPRIVYALHGEPAPLDRLRALVEEGPRSCAELEIEAERLAGPVLDGSIERRHFRPIVRRKRPSA